METLKETIIILIIAMIMHIAITVIVFFTDIPEDMDEIQRKNKKL